MVDTVRVDYFAQWRLHPPPGWMVNESQRTVTASEGEVIPKLGRMMTHEESGLRIGGDREYTRWMEVSLPRILMGNNGLMIRTQEQLDQAINKALETALSVAEPMFGISSRFTRLDLVGQFLIEPADMIAAHKETCHPRIRGGKSHYEGESLHFVGKERHCRIYDKMKESEHRSGHVTRVEWQLRSNAICRDFDRDQITLRTLTIEDCYGVYRRLCSEFVPASLPVDSTLYDILAVAAREGTKLQGVAVFDFWGRGKHPKTVRRVRREVAKRRIETFKIDWHGLLPEEFSDFPMVDYHEPNPF